MFDFFKRKIFKNNILSLVAPVTGRTLPLCQVQDPVFSKKLTGDGIAIIPKEDIIVAPADGELTLVFNTKHAFSITTSNGVEILVHIGLETVSLNGQGFAQLIPTGRQVKAGTPIIRVDRNFVKSKNLHLIIPVLILNMDILKSIKPIENINVVAGKTPIITYTVK